MSKRRLSYLLLFALSILPATAQKSVIISKASLNTMQIVMGDTTTMHLELVQPKGALAQIGLEPRDSVSSFVEMGDIVRADTSDLGNNRIQILADVLVQAYDSGQWHLNPVLVCGTDTARYTKPLLLKVLPVEVDEKADIKDFAPIIDPERHVLDYIPDFVAELWWLWLLIALVATLVVLYFKYWHKGKNPLRRIKKRLPPYEEAMQRLERLKAQQLWQNGREKDYYTTLTDILREYIERRFGINAVEMTTSQIVETLKDNAETQAVNTQLNEILYIADFVKFAGERPLADDNQRSFTRAQHFVEATKPIEPTERKEVDHA